MGSLADCLKIGGFSDIESKLINKAQKAYLKEGYPAEEATQLSVKDVLTKLEAEEASIVKQIQDASQLTEEKRVEDRGIEARKEQSEIDAAPRRRQEARQLLQELGVPVDQIPTETKALTEMIRKMSEETQPKVPVSEESGSELKGEGKIEEEIDIQPIIAESTTLEANEKATPTQLTKLQSKVGKLTEKNKAIIQKAKDTLKEEKGNLKAIMDKKVKDAQDKAQIRLLEQKITSGIKRVEALEAKEKQLADIKSKTVARQAKDTAISKDKIASLQREGELKQLRQRILDRVTFIERGVRQGIISTKQQIKEVQNEVISMIDVPELEAKDKAKFIKKIRDIHTVEQLRKAMPEIRERVEKLATAFEKRAIAKKIVEPVAEATDFRYREAIEHIQSALDPALRAERTLKRRQMLRDFIAENKDASIPVKLMQKINATPLNELSIEELNGILEEVDRLRQLGELKQRLKVQKRENEIQQAVNSIANEATDGVGIVPPEKKILTSVTTRETTGGKLQKVGRYSRAITLRMPRITRLLEGKEGEAFKWFVWKVNRARDTTLRNSDKRYEDMNVVRDKLNIDLPHLASVRKVNGTPYTVSDMLSVYVGEKNARKKLALIYGNNLSLDDIHAVINQMTESEKKLGDAILEDYKINMPNLRESVIDNENRDMGIEENYSPMRRRDIDYKTPKEQILDELLHRKAYKKGYSEKGFTIARKDIPEEFQKPIQLGEYEIWLSQVALQEEYINLMGLTKDLHKIAGDKTFQDAVRTKLGEEYIDRFSNYVSRVANPNIYKSFEGWENLSRQLRGNVALAYLAGNLVTAGKQLPSVLLYLPEAGLQHLTASLAEFVNNPIKLVHKMKELDPQVKHRSIERELEELKNLSSKELYAKVRGDVRKYGMLGIRMLDMIAITIGQNAVYNKKLSEGYSKEIAMEKAQQVSLDTQPQAHPKDLPEIYAMNEVLNWFLQFTNQLNNIYNIATVDIPGYAGKGEWTKAFYGTVAMSTVSIVIWSVVNKRLPDDEDDIIDAFSDQAFNMIPLVGKQLQQTINGPDYGGDIPPIKGVRDLAASVKHLANGDYDKSANSLFRGLSPLIGNPLVAEKRTYNALESGDVLELIGGKYKTKSSGGGSSRGSTSRGSTSR